MTSARLDRAARIRFRQTTCAANPPLAASVPLSTDVQAPCQSPLGIDRLKDEVVEFSETSIGPMMLHFQFYEYNEWIEVPVLSSNSEIGALWER